jgi:SAM-dependent methyltransferase
MSGPAADAEAVKAFERAGWSEKAASYGLLTGRITARFIEPLLDAAEVRAGTRILDVGTGPGHAARGAAERGAVATGVDIADEVVALARRRHAGVRFVRADAEELPFAEHSFDGVVCNFAINHVPRPERAMREIARVAVPGARIALTSWDLPERNRFLGILVDALKTSGVTPAVTGPDPYRFADDGEFGSLLGSAGLEDVEVRARSLVQRVADTDELWRGLLGGSVRTAGLVMDQTSPTRAKIRAALDRLAEEYRVDAELALPVRAKLARGRRS